MTAALDRRRANAAMTAGEPVNPEDRWRPLTSAPVEQDVEVTIGPGAIVLARKNAAGQWCNRATGRPLKVRPLKWRLRG